jgi:hypothetical protein
MGPVPRPLERLTFFQFPLSSLVSSTRPIIIDKKRAVNLFGG